jgi:hypothetical protein
MKEITKDRIIDMCNSTLEYEFDYFIEGMTEHLDEDPMIPETERFDNTNGCIQARPITECLTKEALYEIREGYYSDEWTRAFLILEDLSEEG